MDKPEMLWRLKQHEQHFVAEAAPIPANAMRVGKGIDGLHLDGNRLIAVDDFMMPKYIFVFDISSGLSEPSETGVLPMHTTYEHVFKTAAGCGYLALLSRGINHGNSTAHVSLLDIKNLQEVWSDRTKIVPRHERSWLDKLLKRNFAPISDLPTYLDVAIANDRLYVAAGPAGLGSISLGELSDENGLSYSDIGGPVSEVSATSNEPGCFAVHFKGPLDGRSDDAEPSLEWQRIEALPD